MIDENATMKPEILLFVKFISLKHFLHTYTVLSIDNVNIVMMKLFYYTEPADTTPLGCSVWSHC